MAHPYGWICGCYYLLPPSSKWSTATKQYLAQVNTKAHTTILSSTSRTTLTQTFTNPSDTKAIKELSYSFPLYDGVSVVGFTCRIGERVIEGQVKEKEKARAVYKEAKERGEVAGLLEQLPQASDVFVTKLGNVPPGADIVVNITYLGELKHDAEVDGVRFTIPSHVAPRYGDYPTALSNASLKTAIPQGFEVVIDAELSEGAYIRELRSPSHPIAVSLGTTSATKSSDPTPNKASATLSLGTAELSKDFILQLVAKETSTPKALLETHPTFPNQRALMATLVPKFSLPPERPELVFVCDRSGSMMGSKITALRNALKVFLKSLPLGVKFNICSFGSSFSFLWGKSHAYSQESLDEAMRHIEGFEANFGGTEMYRPLEESIKRRYTDMNLEIFLVTDGEIWDQQRLLDLLNEEIGRKKQPIRVFTLGVGDAFSSSLVEGVARAGNGFSQAVGENEKLDGKVVRMLKAALSPHISDFSLEVKYADGKVDRAAESLSITLDESKIPSTGAKIMKKAISLFDTTSNPDNDAPSTKPEDKFNHLAAIDPPVLLQAPHKIPPLFPFSRTTVYLLLSSRADTTRPVSVTLKASSRHGPLELEIPVQVLDKPGETIHQLAAKKAVHELEEGRGWLSAAKDAASEKMLKDKYEGRFSEFVEREAVRLGVQFQVAGKFCSFVAVEKKEGETKKMDEDWDFLDEDISKMNLAEKAAENDEEMGMSLFGASIRYVPQLADNDCKRTAKLSSPKKRITQMAMKSAVMEPKTGTDEDDRSAGVRKRSAGYVSQARFTSTTPSQAHFTSTTPSAPRASASYGSASLFGAAPSQQAAFGAPPAPGGVSGDYGHFLGMSGRGSGRGGMMSMAGNAAPPPPPAAPAASSDSRSFKKKASRAAAPENGISEAITMSMSSSNALDEDDLEDELAGLGYSPTSPSHSPISSFQSSITRGENLPGYTPDKSKEVRHFAPAPKAAPPLDPLTTLIELQTFEGFWALTPKLCQVIGVDAAEVEKAATDAGMGVEVVATALAVRFLTLKLKVMEDSWELVAEKAKGWLEGMGVADGGEVWKVVEGMVA